MFGSGICRLTPSSYLRKAKKEVRRELGTGPGGEMHPLRNLENLQTQKRGHDVENGPKNAEKGGGGGEKRRRGQRKVDLKGRSVRSGAGRTGGKLKSRTQI